MAVNFQHHIDLLIRDFQRRGLKPEIVQVSGNPPRAMEIRVAKKISVHWDADSRSVWAEGPWPEIERLENYIRRRFSGRLPKRGLAPKKLLGVLCLGLLATLVLAAFVPGVRSHLTALPWLAADEKPKSKSAATQPEEVPSNPAKETKSVETVATE